MRDILILLGLGIVAVVVAWGVERYTRRRERDDYEP